MRAVVLGGLLLLLTACKAGPRIVIQEQEDNTPAQPAAVSNWEYKTDGNTSWACARSTDNTAELCFRRAQGHLDSYMHLPFREGNPFFCQRGRCPTKVKVDSAPEQTIQGTDDEGGGTRILFLPAPEKLLHQLEQAKELRVSPPMFGVDQEFVFQVGGLKWK